MGVAGSTVEQLSYGAIDAEGEWHAMFEKNVACWKHLKDDRRSIGRGWNRKRTRTYSL